MEVNEHLHSPDTLTPGKDPLVFAEQEAKWAPELVWMIWSREKSVSPVGS